MKKITLLTAFLTACLFLFGNEMTDTFAQSKVQQNSPLKVRHLSKAESIETVKSVQKHGIKAGANNNAKKMTPVFSEDFEGLTGNVLPPGWTQFSIATDGGFYTGDNTETRIFTCADPTDFFPIPAHTNFAMTNDDCCDCDKSFDLLEMPSVDLTGLFNYELAFYAYQRDNCPGMFCDSTFIEVSTDGGSIWNRIFALSGVTIGVWKRFAVDLSAFDNMPDVRIRFHYDDLGNWGYGVAIDDITVDLRADHDLSLDEGVTHLDTFQTPVYTQIPFRQVGTITFDGRITNFGVLTQNNVILNATVIHDSVNTVFNENNPALLSLLPGEDSLLTVTPDFIPPVTGSYTVNFTVSADSTDANPLDNTVTKSFGVSDTVFARDHDNPSGQISLSTYIGVTGPGYAFANFFETTSADTATSISFMLGNRTIVGTVIQGKIYDFNELNQNGVGVEIAATIFYTIQAADTSGTFLTLSLTSELPLTGPTNYFAAIHEFGSDSAMTIAAESNTGVGIALLFDQGDNTWYSISAIPYIRLNLKAPPVVCNLGANINISCAGGIGAIDVTPTGGTSPYTYLWSPGGQVTQNISGLAIGTYAVTITDANNCQYAVSNLDIPVPVASVSGNLLFCPGDSTMLTAGTELFATYIWSTGDTAQSIYVDTAGVYTLTVIDTNGCADTTNVTVSFEPIPSVIVSVTGSTTFCHETDSANLTASGGAFYLWSNGSTQQTLNLTDSTELGDYWVIAYNVCGDSTISDTTTVIIYALPSIDIGAMVIDSSRCDSPTGAITGIIAGGPPPFTYEWNPGLQTTIDATGLSVGAYILTVTDSNTCVNTSGPHTVSSFSSLPAPDTSLMVVDSSRCDMPTGAITGITVGGTPLLTFEWTDTSSTVVGDDSLNLFGVPAGVYTLTVTDSIGCSATSGPHTVPDFSPPSPPTITVDGVDPFILISSPGGAYQWYRNGSQISVGGTNQSYNTQGQIGNYQVTVTDTSTGCTSLLSQIEVISGINEINPGMMFNIYPNPNNGQFIIELSNVKKEDYLIEVRNIIGQLIYTEEVEKTSVDLLKIDLSEHNQGVYFLSISSSSGTRTVKLIVY